MTKKPEPLAIAWDSGEERPEVLISKAERKEIVLIKKVLNVGDYTVIPYADRCCIEAKWSVGDLAGSFTARRKQFEAMWQRAWAHYMKVLIIVGSWHDLEHENYRADFPTNSFIQTLLQWQQKYGFNYVFVPDKAEGLQRVYLYCVAFQRMIDRGTIGKEPQPWRYLLDSATWVGKTAPGTFDKTPRKAVGGFGGEEHTISRAEEHANAEMQLGVAETALRGRRGTK